LSQHAQDEELGNQSSRWAIISQIREQMSGPEIS
jgi:hypothetical protein